MPRLIWLLILLAGASGSIPGRAGETAPLPPGATRVTELDGEARDAWKIAHRKHPRASNRNWIYLPGRGVGLGCVRLPDEPDLFVDTCDGNGAIGLNWAQVTFPDLRERGHPGRKLPAGTRAATDSARRSW